MAIVSPSGAIAPEHMEGGIRQLENAGLRVKVSPHATGFKTGVFSAPDNLRARDLAEALADPDVDAVWCARGGYGAMRTLEALDAFGGWREVFTSTDKMIVGFSDITVLHTASACCGHVGVHGPMLKHLALNGVNAPDVQATLDALRGRGVEARRPAQTGSRDGEASGTLIGGNLSIVYSLAAAGAMPSADGAILFLEDLAEYRYHVDRMMRALRFSGFLSRLSGLVVGRMTDMKDGATPFGKDAYAIVAEAVADYGYPVFIGFPAGHGDGDIFPLVIGGQCTLRVGGGEGVVTQRLV